MIHWSQLWLTIVLFLIWKKKKPTETARLGVAKLLEMIQIARTSLFISRLKCYIFIFKNSSTVKKELNQYF